MDVRGVLLVGVLSVAAIVSATTSCSAPDPGQITFSERPKGSSGELVGGSSGTSGGGPTDAGGTTTEAGTDAGTSGAPDPVFGTTAFALGTPGSGTRAKGNANHAALGAGNDPSGKDCVIAGCHLDARPWAFAGTLYTDSTGATPVPGAEVRVTGPDGKEYAHTYSDVDGNFWIDAPGTGFPANSRVGVRTATKKMLMAGNVSTGQAGCQQAGTCHGGSTGKVYLK